MGRFLVVAILSVACGGSDPGEPLLAGSLTGSADGVSFEGGFGVSTVLESGTVATIVGSGEINCGDVSTSLPPSGIYVNIQIPQAIVGTPSEHFFLFSIIEGGDLRGGGSGSGTIDVTAVSDETIAMTVDYSDTAGEVAYAASGSFEVIRCR